MAQARTAPDDEARADKGAPAAPDDHADAPPGPEPDGADDVAVSAGARLEASHELSQAWANAVVDLTFAVGERRVRIDTAREIDGHADRWTVHGRIGRRGGSRVAIELGRPLFDALLADLPDALDLDEMEPSDAALVFEHVLGAALSRIEAEIGEPIEFESVEAGPLVTELEPIIAAVWIDRMCRTVRVVFDDPMHMRILTEWLRPLRMDDEFGAGDVARVEVGPIELSLDELDDLEVGDAITIGTELGKNLVGVLVRGTGRTLPVTIDTGEVTVLGPVREPRRLPEHLDPAPLGVEIGTVRLTPNHLARAKEGGRFIMERNADNRCALRLGDGVVARGELTLIDGQLGVEILSLGAAALPDVARAPKAEVDADGNVTAPPPPAAMEMIAQSEDEQSLDEADAAAPPPARFRVG